MKFFIPNNKKSMSIAIVLLVILALILILLSLTYFSNRKTDLIENLRLNNKLDDIYIKEDKINTVVENIFEESARNISFSSDKSVFINEFKKNLDNLKNNGIYPNDLIGLSQVENQINPENVILNQEKLSLKINLVLKDSEKIDEKDPSKTNEYSYSYSKEFVKLF